MASARDDHLHSPSEDNPYISESSVNVFCPLCHEMFTHPRLLPCLHTFCKRCLESLIVPRSNFLTCPACRSEIPITVCSNNSNQCFLNLRIEPGKKRTILGLQVHELLSRRQKRADVFKVCIKISRQSRLPGEFECLRGGRVG